MSQHRINATPILSPVSSQLCGFIIICSPPVSHEAQPQEG